MTRRVILSSKALVLAAALIGSCVAPVAAQSNTGTLSGTATDAQTKQPLADVHVVATSPSGTYSTVTSAKGFYVITGVVPDSYTISFQKTNYLAQAIPGVSAYAAQSTSTNVTLARASLKTIAIVSANSPGSALRPSQTTDTYTVTESQINELQGTPFNTSETDLILALPGTQEDQSGYPTIHGGRNNEVQLQVEGIPYTDPFVNSFMNSLETPGAALSMVQLTPGGGAASDGNNGTGTVNELTKRGTYPGKFDIGQGIGSPYFDHTLYMEYGTAAPNGKWSEYAMFSGANIGDLWGGRNAPSATNLHVFYNRFLETDRTFINNFIYRFGKNNSKSIQLFFDNESHNFYDGYGGNPQCFKTCDPLWLSSAEGYFLLSKAQLQAIMPLQPGQSDPNQTLAEANTNPETYYQPMNAYKVEFDDNIDPATFLDVRFYHSDDLQIYNASFPGLGQYAGGWDSRGGAITGLNVDFIKQLDAHSLLSAGASISYNRGIFDDVSNTYGMMDLTNAQASDFIPASAVNAQNPCVVSEDVRGATCGWLSQYFPDGIPKVPEAITTVSLTSQYLAFYVSDKYRFNDHLYTELGLRMDGGNYDYPTPGIDPATCTTQYEPVSWTYPASGRVPGDCGSATFALTKAETNPRVLQPRLGITYDPTPRDSLRFTFGRSTVLPLLGTIDHTAPASVYAPFENIPAHSPWNYATNCGVSGYQVKCVNYGEQLQWDNIYGWAGTPITPVLPETTSNYELTYAHQFHNGWAFSISPWARREYNAFVNENVELIKSGAPVVNPDQSLVYGPSIRSNNGQVHGDGVDLRVTRDVRQGLSGQLNLSYVNEFSSVIPLSGSEDFGPSIPPASVELGNTYRVGYLQPFSGMLALTYRTKKGWSFNPRVFFGLGFPIGSGLILPAIINGVAYNIPNTNASSALEGAPNGASQYIDPDNPGSYFNPNIAATRGTPEAASPGGVLSHARLTTNLTISYAPTSKATFGINLSNLFNQTYYGPLYNPYYQPAATGLSGPETGQTYLSWENPTYNYYGYANYDPATQSGTQAYRDVPSNIGFNYYVFAKFTI